MQSFGLTNFSDIRGVADYYDALMSIWTASPAAMALNVHTVIYEELVRDPEATLRLTLDFLGLEWTTVSSITVAPRRNAERSARRVTTK